MGTIKADPAKAETFVRELFRHVLRMPSPPQAQVDAWTKRAIAQNDWLATFQAFIAGPARQRQHAIEQDAWTRWHNGHFYSPVVSHAEVRADSNRIFGQRELPGIDLREDAQLALLGHLAPHFSTMPFTGSAQPGFRYRFENPSYGLGDAAVYWAMLHHFRPRRILEVGSGFSSALALDAVDRIPLDCACTFVDPYPAVAEAATAPLNPPHRILPQRIQDIDIKEIQKLEVNDILFIDSSHVLKTGSDVHHELTEMLPRLSPGVLIHFHDVFTGFEYSSRWILEKSHNWNEIYALHCFLMFNSGFQIEYFNDYVARRHADAIRRLAPSVSDALLRNPGGGLWLRRV